MKSWERAWGRGYNSQIIESFFYLLQSLLSRALLNGNLPEANPCALLQRMNNIFSAVVRREPCDLLTSTATTTTLRSELLYQCSHTHCAGHALLLALLSQKCVNVGSSADHQAQAGEVNK